MCHYNCKFEEYSGSVSSLNRFSSFPELFQKCPLRVPLFILLYTHYTLVDESTFICKIILNEFLFALSED